MRIVIGLAAALLLGTAAHAQVPLKPGTPFILSWSPQQQAEGYRSMEAIYKSRTVARGGHVHPLPKAAAEIAPTWSHDGKAWTVDSYMAAYNVSGILVIKDGRILLEK